MGLGWPREGWGCRRGKEGGWRGLAVRQIQGRPVRGAKSCSGGGRREERAVPSGNPQGQVWAHLRRVGGAQLSKVPDSGSAEGAGALGAVRRAGVFGPPLPTPGRGNSRGGTARERARTQLAPKIPNWPRGPAQERLLPPMWPIRGAQPAGAPPRRPCVRVVDAASPDQRSQCAGAKSPQLRPGEEEGGYVVRLGG